MERTEKERILGALQKGLIEGLVRMAISGPHFDLRHPSQHFYEVNVAYLDHEARARIEGWRLPPGFSYAMESGVDYVEDMVCEAIVDSNFREYHPIIDFLALVANGIVNESETETKSTMSDFAHVIYMTVRIHGDLYGKVIYDPVFKDDRRFQIKRWDDGTYVECGRKATLQQAVDALLEAY